MRVELADGATRFAGRERHCRRGWTEFGGATGLDAGSVGDPTAITLVAHGSGGQVRRARFLAR